MRHPGPDRRRGRAPRRRARIVALSPGRHLARAAAALAWCWTSAAFAEPIDLSGYELVFDEPFDALDVSPWREDGDSRWTAHTPWRGDFGDAVFTDPRPGFPFAVAAGILRIEAKRDETGLWRSGLLTTGDPNGGGFQAESGYFEARMKLPPGDGVWPAFWLGSLANERGLSGEIDVVEFYGHDPSAYQGAWHVWKTDPETGEVSHPASDLKRLGAAEGVPADLAGSWHTWGVEVGPEEIVYHFDREPVWRVPTPAEFEGVRFFPLVNLALGSGWPTDETPDPSHLYVDHVRVWRRLDAGAAER